MRDSDDPAASFRVRRVLLFGVVLGVPAIGFVIAEGLIAYDDARRTLPLLLSRVSLGAASLGLLLIAVIRAGGRAAAGSRNLLLWLFRPGLYVTAVSLAVLVLIHGAIAIALFVCLLGWVGSIAMWSLFLSLILGTVVGAAAIIRGVFSLVRSAETDVVGILVDFDVAPRLCERVKRIAYRIGSLRPQHIVLGLYPNFFVTQADVKCLNGTVSGRTLFCSLPLARILDTRQFEAILGHEFGHFKGKDTEYSARFYPIYRGTVLALESVSRVHRERGVPSIILLPAVTVLSYFMETFSFAERGLSRDRELAADEQGARVTDPHTTAAALVKCHVFALVWKSLGRIVFQTLRKRSMFINLSKLFADEAASAAGAELLKDISESCLEHPTDTHPPLSARLDALGVDLKDAAIDGLVLEIPDPAIGLLEDPDRIERQLTIALQERIAPACLIDLEELPPPERVYGESWSAKRRRERLRSLSRKRHR